MVYCNLYLGNVYQKVIADESYFKLFIVTQFCIFFSIFKTNVNKKKPLTIEYKIPHTFLFLNKK